MHTIASVQAIEFVKTFVRAKWRKACPQILDTRYVTAQTFNADHARQATASASDY